MRTLQEAIAESAVGMAMKNMRDGRLIQVHMFADEEMTKEMGEPVFSGHIWIRQFSMEYGLRDVADYSFGSEFDLLEELKIQDVKTSLYWESIHNATL